MEEIGYRTAIYSLDDVTGSQREYMTWLINACAVDGVGIDDILAPSAVDLLASRLRTPLQIEQPLTLALEAGCQANEKPISETFAITRNGYGRQTNHRRSHRPRSKWSSWSSTSKRIAACEVRRTRSSYVTPDFGSNEDC
jgi:hypothetical protein